MNYVVLYKEIGSLASRDLAGLYVSHSMVATYLIEDGIFLVGKYEDLLEVTDNSCEACDGRGWVVGGQTEDAPYGEQIQCHSPPIAVPFGYTEEPPF